MTFGIISDTHGYLDPRIEGVFEGVDHIFHAGDIGYASIILELEKIAPVTAVLGNNDAGLNFNETEVIALDGRKFLVHHILTPSSPHDGIKSLLVRENPEVVIFGHSHQRYSRTIGRTLYFNPGYAGKPRFNQLRSVAILRCDAEGIREEFVGL